MPNFIMSYLGSTVTPGQAGNQFWALIYVLIIFAGVSVAVLAMNWIERKALAHFQIRLGPMRVGPHGLLQPIRRCAQVDAQGRHHSRRSRPVRFLGRAADRPACLVHGLYRDSVRPVAGRERHEHRHPLYARRLVARRARHRRRGMGFELALSADRRAAIECADGILRSRYGPGRDLGHPDDQYERNGHRHAEHDWDRAGAAAAGDLVHL